MAYSNQDVDHKISAFIARKAEQHPDVFIDQEDEVSPAEMLELQIAYA